MTGLAAYPVIKSLTDRLGGAEINVVPIINDFFGHNITVSGLLTGRDIVNQLTGMELGDELLLPSSLLRHGEEVLLDDMTVGEISSALNIPVKIVESNGAELLDALLH